MICKAFEIRDAGTFIPVIAIWMTPSRETDLPNAEHYLLRRAGYGYDSPCVMLCRTDANGGAHQASCDPHGWGWPRTYPQAHEYITEHFHGLQSGQVIDVEFILGETTEAKLSESVA